MSLKEINCQAPVAPLTLKVKPKTRLNACFLGLFFLNDLAKGGLSPFPLVAQLTAT